MEQADYKQTEIMTIPLHHLNRVVDSLNKQIEDKDTPISFEFIIASLFPTVMDHI